MLARLAVQWQATEIEGGEKKETPLPLSGSGVHKGDNRGSQRATEAALPWLSTVNKYGNHASIGTASISYSDTALLEMAKIPQY